MGKNMTLKRSTVEDTTKIEISAGKILFSQDPREKIELAGNLWGKVQLLELATKVTFTSGR